MGGVEDRLLDAFLVELVDDVDGMDLLMAAGGGQPKAELLRIRSPECSASVAEVSIGGDRSVNLRVDEDLGRLEPLQRADDDRDLLLSVRRQDVVDPKVDHVGVRIRHVKGAEKEAIVECHTRTLSKVHELPPARQKYLIFLSFWRSGGLGRGIMRACVGGRWRKQFVSSSRRLIATIWPPCSGCATSSKPSSPSASPPSIATRCGSSTTRPPPSPGSATTASPPATPSVSSKPVAAPPTCPPSPRPGSRDG